MDDDLHRHDLADEEWERLEPLMPAHPRQGHQWNDHRTMINGILFRTRAEYPWRDLPACYGYWKTVYGRHRRWSADGTWEQVLGGVRRGGREGLDGSADSTVVRAHQHAAGARRVITANTGTGGVNRMTGIRRAPMRIRARRGREGEGRTRESRVDRLWPARRHA